MPTVTLRPFRDYNEKDVVNLFTYSGVIPATGPFIDQVIPKGTLVRVVGDGFRTDIDEPTEMIGNFGGYSVNNWVGQRYGTVAKVTTSQSLDAQAPLGLMLFDVREYDENGEFLKYRPQKAAEMEAVLSGQTVPIVTKGIFLYSGISTGVTTGSGWVGTAVTAGNSVYAGDSGAVCTTGTNKVGKFLGTTGANTNFAVNSAIALIRFDFI